MRLGLLTALPLLLLLCAAVVFTQALSIPPLDSTREEFKIAYSLCNKVDPQFVFSGTLDSYIDTVRWIATHDLPIVGAMALSGPPTNRGWSTEIYNGMVGFQECFGMTWLMNDSVPESEFQQEMDVFAESGVKFFFSGALEYVAEEIPIAAERHPDIVFLTPFFLPSLASIPNVRAVNARYEDVSYQLGYIAQLMSQAETVGYVASVDFFVEYNALAAYYMGAEDAAAEFGQEKKVFHQIWSTDYVDEDLNMGAFNALIDAVPGIERGLMATTSSNFNVQRMLQSRGIMSTTGSANSGPYVGNLLLGGSVSRWNVVLLNAFYYFAVDGEAQGWGPNTPFLFDSSAYVNSLDYGTLSPIIPSYVVEAVNRVRTRMQISPFESQTMWCGDRVAALLDNPEELDPATKCLNFTQRLTMNKMFPDVVQHGIYELPILEDTLPTYSIAVMSTLIAVGMLFTAFCLGMSIYHQKSAIIRLQSHTLTWAVLVFSLIGQIGLLLVVPTPNTALCMAAVALYAFGLFGMLCLYLTKTYGIYRIINNKPGASLVTLKTIMPLFAVTFCFALLLIILYLAVSNPGSVTRTWLDTDELDKFHTREVCDFDSTPTIVLLSLMVAYCGVLSIVVAVWCFRLGASDNKFSVCKSEARYGMIACGCTLFFLMIGIALVLTITNFDARLWVIVMCGFMINVGNILIFYAPKMFVLIFKSDSVSAGPVAEFTRHAVSGSRNSMPSSTVGLSTSQVTNTSSTHSSMTPRVSIV